MKEVDLHSIPQKEYTKLKYKNKYAKFGLIAVRYTYVYREKTRVVITYPWFGCSWSMNRELGFSVQREREVIER